MTKRYKPVGNWRPNNSEIVVFGASVRYAQYVNIDVSDVREDNGHIWSNGAHRVKVTRPPLWGDEPLPRGKTFIGELAWADAARYAGDAINTICRTYEGR